MSVPLLCRSHTFSQYIKLPNSFAFLAFYLVLGKRSSPLSALLVSFTHVHGTVYANSLLGSLNARHVIFPQANWEKETPRSAPLLTSVVVLDENDDMVTTVVAEDASKRMNGSIGSEDTHVEEGHVKRNSKEDASVQIVQRGMCSKALGPGVLVPDACDFRDTAPDR